jgi:ABC-type lipoprotein release transport system permease subunit
MVAFYLAQQAQSQSPLAVQQHPWAQQAQSLGQQVQHEDSMVSVVMVVVMVNIVFS